MGSHTVTLRDIHRLPPDEQRRLKDFTNEFLGVQIAAAARRRAESQSRYMIEAGVSDDERISEI